MKTNHGKRTDANNMSIYIQTQLSSFWCLVKVYPPEKGFFGGEIKKMGLGFLRGKRNEITQFLKSDSNNMSIYRRKLKRTDAYRTTTSDFIKSKNGCLDLA